MTDPEITSGRACAFTGHRRIPPQTLPELRAHLCRVLAELYAEGFSAFYTGGALGFDQLAAAEVLHLREQHPEVRLTVLCPCRDQDARWTAEQREAYRRQLEQADRVRVLAPVYYPGCMQARNRALIDAAEVCVAYGRRQDSGTAQTVALACAKGIPVIHLDEDPPKTE